MKTDERFDYFCSQWQDLTDDDKIQLFNEYCSDCDFDNYLHSFDEDFFETFFSGKTIEAVRAVYFGNINNWCDEYLKFDGYGNLESYSRWEAAEFADNFQREIYEWDKYEDYIDMDEYDNPEEEEEDEEEEENL